MEINDGYFEFDESSKQTFAEKVFNNRHLQRICKLIGDTFVRPLLEEDPTIQWGKNDNFANLRLVEPMQDDRFEQN